MGLIAFAEASFFPLPPDLLLLPMALARPRTAWHLALICTLCSVAGGALGYLIGDELFNRLATPILADRYCTSMAIRLAATTTQASV